MEKDYRLTDEQLEGVNGGYDGGVELRGPETYLQFSEYERTTGRYWNDSEPREPQEDIVGYLNWYYEYYHKRHPADVC